MPKNDSTITIHMVCSLDGYIARKNGDISWMTTNDNYPPGQELSDEAIQSFLEKIDCYVMGSITYQHALELGWPYGEKPVTVLTSRNMDVIHDTVTFYNGDLKALEKVLRSSYDNIWMVGGSNLTQQFIHQNIADEIVITFLPILLGDGIPFFKSIGQRNLHLKDHIAFKDGMVELTYEISK